jgi:type VI protein secretion system component VasK
MLTRLQFWSLSLLALAALALMGANMLMIMQNRAAQAEISARAQYVQQAAQLEPLYREMVRVLAEMAVRNNDSAIRDLLAKQGITVGAAVPPAPPDTAATAPASAAKKGGK